MKIDLPLISKPSFLKINAKCHLSLDGFNENSKIAFEYNPRHHYEIDGLYTKSDEELGRKIRLDRKKKDICRINNIDLIIIKELPGSCCKDEIVSHIHNCSIESGVVLPIVDMSTININDVYRFNPKKKTKTKKRKEFCEIKSELESLGYKVISDKFDKNKKIKVECMVILPKNKGVQK